MEITPSTDNDLNGTISYLYRTFPETFWSLVSIDGSKVNKDGWSEKHVLIDPSITGNNMADAWCSENFPYSNISLHFSKHHISITNYTLKTRTIEPSDFPTAWILYGSLDNETWIMVDERTNIEDLNQLNLARTYSVKKEGIYNHFRFIQTNNSFGRHVFGLSKVEFFGKIIDNYKVHIISCKRNLGNTISVFYLYVVLYIYQS